MKLQDRLLKYLVPAGNGVHTVQTAKDKKEKLHQVLYGTNDDHIIKSIWTDHVKKIGMDRVHLLGITSDAGGGIQRGANWGPLFCRLSILNEMKKILDLGDIKTNPHLLHDKYLNDETIKSCQQAMYTGEELPVSPLSIAEDFCADFFQHYPNRKIIFLGGDHSVSYPLVAEYLKARKQQNKKVALIHFDAHTDLLESRLGIDYCFGSWTFHILPLLETPKHLYQLGIRSSGFDRSHWETKHKHQQIWSDEINSKGAQRVANEMISALHQLNVEELYISFDIDAIDSYYAAATGTPEPNGMKPDQAITILKLLAENFVVSAFDLVEVAPFVNQDPKIYPNAQSTTMQTVSIILNNMIEIMDEQS